MEDANILIREVTRKSEIVDNSTWVLVNDGGQNVLIHRAPKDVAKALSDGSRCFYVSPDVFVGDFHFDNVLFPEKPKGLSVDVSFRMKLLPEMSGFADWVKTNVEYKLTIEEFVQRMAKPKYGLKHFLQHSLEGVTNFDLLRKHGKEAVPTFVGQDKSVEPWLYIAGMQWINADDVPADKRNWLNEFSAQQEARSKELDQMRADLSFATEKGSLDDAFKVVEYRQRLNKLARESALLNAEIEKATKERELIKIKEEISTLTHAEKVRVNELDNILEKYHAALQKIEQLEKKDHQPNPLPNPDDFSAGYEKLSRIRKVLLHVRIFMALPLYFLFSNFAPSLKGLPDIAKVFVLIGVWIVLCSFLRGWKPVGASLGFILNLFRGKLSIDIKGLVLELSRMVLGFFCLLGSSCLIFYFFTTLIELFFGTPIWYHKIFGFGLGDDDCKRNLCMIGFGLGLLRFSLLLLLDRRIRCTHDSVWKWMCICFLPALCVWPMAYIPAIEQKLAQHDATVKVIKAYKESDYKLAVKFLPKADQQDVAVLAIGAELYSGGKKIDPDYKKAVFYTEKSIEKGVYKTRNGLAQAQWNIGRAYFKMTNHVAAAKWFKASGDNGCAEAIYMLGTYYVNGKGGVSKDLRKAIQLFHQSLSEQNIFLNMDTKRDAKRSIDLLNKSLSEEKSQADTQAAIDAFKNQEFEKAWKLVSMADSSNPVLQAYMGDAYLQGNGVTCDAEKAITCYKKVEMTKRGTGALYFNIGFCYHSLTNYDDAAKYMRIAVDHSEVDAWLYLGMYYEFGLGGYEKNYKLAEEAYRKASQSSNKEVVSRASRGSKRVTSKMGISSGLNKSGGSSATPSNHREHIVRQGDSFGKIAHDNGVTIRRLKEYNGLTNNSLRIGQKLLIPLDSASDKHLDVVASKEDQPTSSMKMSDHSQVQSRSVSEKEMPDFSTMFNLVK